MVMIRGRGQTVWGATTFLLLSISLHLAHPSSTSGASSTHETAIFPTNHSEARSARKNVTIFASGDTSESTTSTKSRDRKAWTKPGVRLDNGNILSPLPQPWSRSISGNGTEPRMKILKDDVKYLRQSEKSAWQEVLKELPSNLYDFQRKDTTDNGSLSSLLKPFGSATWVQAVILHLRKKFDRASVKFLQSHDTSKDPASRKTLLSTNVQPDGTLVLAKGLPKQPETTDTIKLHAQAGIDNGRIEQKSQHPHFSRLLSSLRVPSSPRVHTTPSQLSPSMMWHARHSPAAFFQQQPSSLLSFLLPNIPDDRLSFPNPMSHSSSSPLRPIDPQSRATPDTTEVRPSLGGSVAAHGEPVSKTNTPSPKSGHSSSPPSSSAAMQTGTDRVPSKQLVNGKQFVVDSVTGANAQAELLSDIAVGVNGVGLDRTTTAESVLKDEYIDPLSRARDLLPGWSYENRNEILPRDVSRVKRELSLGDSESTETPRSFFPSSFLGLPVGELGPDSVTLGASLHRHILHNLDNLESLGVPTPGTNTIATDATPEAGSSNSRLLGAFGSLLNLMRPNATASSTPSLAPSGGGIPSGEGESEVPCGAQCEDLGGRCVLGSNFRPRCDHSRPLEETGCLNGFRCDHGTCQAGSARCECEAGWTGPFCADRCELDCDQGYCFRLENGSSVCVCNVNYTGSLCTEFNPPDILQKDGVPVSVGPATWPMVVAGAGTGLLLLLLLLYLPYVTWRRRWLPMRRLVHYFQSYEDDDGKPFDAFVSYKSCKADETWVVHTLYPKLEKEMDFKLCLHFRDFPPGETIANNIINAIENSRRTIMVLSPSYVKSEWCRLEYQKAQHEMLKLKHKIIPVVLEDISTIPDMDRNLKTLLDTVTYIQWPRGEEDETKRAERFWKHVQLAMPKKRSESSSSSGSSSSSSSGSSSSSESSGASGSTDIALTSISSSCDSVTHDDPTLGERAQSLADSPVFVDLEDAVGVDLDEGSSSADVAETPEETFSESSSVSRQKARAAKYARSESTEVMLEASDDHEDDSCSKGGDKYVVKVKHLPGNRLKIFKSKLLGPSPAF